MCQSMFMNILEVSVPVAFSLIVVIWMIRKAECNIVHFYFLSLGIKGILASLSKLYAENALITGVNSAFPWIMIVLGGIYFLRTLLISSSKKQRFMMIPG